MITKKTSEKTNAVVNATENVANVESKNVNDMQKEQMTATENVMFDLEIMFAREESKIPVTIHQERINEINRYMKSEKLTSVILSFHQRNNGKFYLKIMFNMDKVSKTLWTPADYALAFAVMCAMRGKYDLLESYKAEEHTTLKTSDNIVIGIFKEFMASRLRKRIGRDFCPKRGGIYKSIIFNLAKNRFIKIWVELTDEVNTIINEVCFGTAA